MRGGPIVVEERAVDEGRTAVVARLDRLDVRLCDTRGTSSAMTSWPPNHVAAGPVLSRSFRACFVRRVGSRSPVSGTAPRGAAGFARAATPGEERVEIARSKLVEEPPQRQAWRSMRASLSRGTRSSATADPARSEPGQSAKAERGPTRPVPCRRRGGAPPGAWSQCPRRRAEAAPSRSSPRRPRGPTPPTRRARRWLSPRSARPAAAAAAVVASRAGAAQCPSGGPRGRAGAAGSKPRIRPPGRTISPSCASVPRPRHPASGDEIGVDGNEQVVGKASQADDALGRPGSSGRRAGSRSPPSRRGLAPSGSRPSPAQSRARSQHPATGSSSATAEPQVGRRRRCSATFMGVVPCEDVRAWAARSAAAIRTGRQGWTARR